MAKTVRDSGEKSALWRRRVEGWAGSGDSQTEYCRRRGLNRGLFVYWKRRLAGTTTTASAAVEVVEVPAAGVPGSEGRGSGVGVLFAGWRVELEADFDEGTLRRVLVVLRATL